MLPYSHLRHRRHVLRAARAESRRRNRRGRNLVIGHRRRVCIRRNRCRRAHRHERQRDNDRRGRYRAESCSHELFLRVSG